MEEKAARAYDLAALKYWGASTHINFPVRRSPPSPSIFDEHCSMFTLLVCIKKNFACLLVIGM